MWKEIRNIKIKQELMLAAAARRICSRNAMATAERNFYGLSEEMSLLLWLLMVGGFRWCRCRGDPVYDPLPPPPQKSSSLFSQFFFFWVFGVALFFFFLRAIKKLSSCVVDCLLSVLSVCLLYYGVLAKNVPLSSSWGLFFVYFSYANEYKFLASLGLCAGWLSSVTLGHAEKCAQCLPFGSQQFVPKTAANCLS